MIIERATTAELDAIADIERHSFPVAWPRATFEAELAREHAHIIIARPREPRAAATRVVGFCNYWLVADEVHVLAIASHPDHRRVGVGARLLDHALDHGRRAGCARATLEVRRGNRPAIALYQRAGFRGVHVRTRYYQDNNEDALVMLCDLAITG